MNLITRADYDEIVKTERYYQIGPPNERWHYIVIAIRWLNELCPQKTLEIGAHVFPLDKDGRYVDIIDFSKRLGSHFVHHDITKVPWPFANKEFDVIMALQVWEHLEGDQKKAFLELTRVGKSAILSFPYMWLDGGPGHVGIDKKTISNWCLGMIPIKEIIIPGVKNRIIQLYRFK